MFSLKSIWIRVHVEFLFLKTRSPKFYKEFNWNNLNKTWNNQEKVTVTKDFKVLI